MSKTTLFAAIAIVIIAISLVIVGIILMTGKDKKGDLDQVKVVLRYNQIIQFEGFSHEKWAPSARFAGFYTAQQKGFYEQNGINIILTTGTTDFSVLNLLRNGETFRVTGVDQILRSRDNGYSWVILAVIFQKNPFVLVTINENITKPQDLIGKKIGLKTPSNLSNSDILFFSMFNNTNITKEQVEIVKVGFDTEPLIKGEVDAYEVFALDELIGLQEKGYKLYVINPADYGVEFYADAIFASEEQIKQNPDLIRRFVNATLEGWNYAYAHPEEAVDYTLIYSDSLNREHESKIMNEVLGLLRLNNKPIGYIDKNILQSMQNMLLEKKLIKGIRGSMGITAASASYTTEFIGDA